MVYSGKWHVSREEGPEDRGWEDLGSGPKKGAMERARDAEVWKQARAELSADELRAQGQIFRPGWGHRLVYGSIPARGPNGYEGTGDYHTVERALKVLPQLAAGDKSWCLFIGVNGPHDAFIIPEPFAKMYDADEVELPPNFYDTLEDKPRIYQRMRRQYWGQLTEREVRESVAHYWGYCTMEDTLFGLVLDALRETGQEENTLVIYMSDHGDYCGAHGLYCKGVPAFREAYHVPTIMRWPRGIINPGRRVDAFVSHADFAPTFLELAGCEPTMELAGQSLLPWLYNETPANWRDAIFTQLNGVELYYTQRAVTTERYKYVYNGFDFDELYDLKNDPHEMVNLAFPDRVPQIPLHSEERLTNGQPKAECGFPPCLRRSRGRQGRQVWGDRRGDSVSKANTFPGQDYPQN
jgi:arylsulfatase A-like enzyme